MLAFLQPRCIANLGCTPLKVDNLIQYFLFIFNSYHFYIAHIAVINKINDGFINPANCTGTCCR
jgi:hypothetical protein